MHCIRTCAPLVTMTAMPLGVTYNHLIILHKLPKTQLLFEDVWDFTYRRSGWTNFLSRP